MYKDIFDQRLGKFALNRTNLVVEKMLCVYPIGSMYVFTYIWLMFTVNVGKYTRSMGDGCFTQRWRDETSQMNETAQSWRCERVHALASC